MSLSYNYPPQMAYPSAPPVYRGFPAPPRLHWAIVFALSFVTIGIFGMIWMVVQANWVRKVTKNSKPFIWCLIYLLFLPLMAFAGGVGGVMSSVTKGESAAQTFMAVVTIVAQLGGLVLYVCAAYTLKGALEAEMGLEGEVRRGRLLVLCAQPCLWAVRWRPRQVGPHHPGPLLPSSLPT